MNEQGMSLSQAASMVAAPHSTNAMVSTREAQEVQAAVFMAKRFPRDENAAISRILTACKRPGLAEKAVYTYPKGGSNVSGPSVRLAEAIAQAWGNIQSGVVELEQHDGESVCMAYCWDIETNTRECKIFVVPHAIKTKTGMKVLTDPREIYELVANQGARRKRACILNIIPGDVVDSAIAECNKTLAGKNPVPLIDRLRELTERFKTYYSVPLQSIELYFGHTLDTFTEQDGVALAGIYNALRDGQSKREDFFQLPQVKDADGENGDAQKPPKSKGSSKVSINDL